ncbi:deoxycytidylate deaminase [Candidatus Mycoplasma pogonae]
MKKNVISWDQYFAALTKLSALRSKDPNTQVGACIINDKKRIIGLGYNGMPKGNDDDFPWNKEGKNVDIKYSYVIHAEINAILNSTNNLEGTILYTSLFPCANCAKTIVQSGIKEVVYLDDIYHDTEDAMISRLILDRSKVKYRHVKSKKLTL